MVDVVVLSNLHPFSLGYVFVFFYVDFPRVPLILHLFRDNPGPEITLPLCIHVIGSDQHLSGFRRSEKILFVFFLPHLFLPEGFLYFLSRQLFLGPLYLRHAPQKDFEVPRPSFAHHRQTFRLLPYFFPPLLQQPREKRKVRQGNTRDTGRREDNLQGQSQRLGRISSQAQGPGEERPRRNLFFRDDFVSYPPLERRQQNVVHLEESLENRRKPSLPTEEKFHLPEEIMSQLQVEICSFLVLPTLRHLQVLFLRVPKMSFGKHRNEIGRDTAALLDLPKGTE